jgi:hypothetical protein
LRSSLADTDTWEGRSSRDTGIPVAEVRKCSFALILVGQNQGLKTKVKLVALVRFVKHRSQLDVRGRSLQLNGMLWQLIQSRSLLLVE